MNRLVISTVFILVACSPKIQPADPKPAWLSGQLNEPRYYTGIGHSTKDGSNNYIQAARKSALDDLVSQIKVTVSSTSILSTFEQNRKEFQERYEQIIQTSVADEIEEFEQAGAFEDETNYWIYLRLSKERYREIKEEQKRNAIALARDNYLKAKQAENERQRLQALGFYFQGLRQIEKYLDEAIRTKIEGEEILLTNEIYASIKNILATIQLRIEPAELLINRRVNLTSQDVMVSATYSDWQQPVAFLPLRASFLKGGGDVFPAYKTAEMGSSKLLINKISSREMAQTISVSLDLDAISGSSSPVYNLLAKTFTVPSTQVLLRVQRPLVYFTSSERTLGIDKRNDQLSNKLKNLLATSGFEFTPDRSAAELWIDVMADSERGSVSGSIYITYLTGVIRVVDSRAGKEIYSTTLDRIKGYGLDYERSSQDAYNKALETLEKEYLPQLLNTILQ